MSNLRRSLLTTGIAVAVVGAVGIASNAGAIETPPPPEVSPPPANVQPVTRLRTPPPTFPGGGKERRHTAAAAAAAAQGDTAPLNPTPVYAPKGHPRSARTATISGTSTQVQPDGTRVVAPEPAVQVAPDEQAAPTSNGRTVAPEPSGQTLTTPAVNFLYASAAQFASADGTYATMTIAKPELDSDDYHSLAEVAAQSSDGQQIVEVGWTVDRGVNGDDNPHLFVYHWVNRQESCYNGCGFVQYSPNIKPGATLPTGVAKRFGIQHYGDVWWIMYDNEWIGYFPDSLWNGAFTRIGLTQWFGEVAAADSAPCTDMGNGRAASNTTAAAITGINFINGPTVKFTPGSTSPYYSAASVSSNGYRFGGPGAC